MLGTRTELRRALLRLVGTDASDAELVRGGEAEGEVLDEALQIGLWNAQRYLIEIGAGSNWITSAALTFGAADATGTRSASPPPDLLRFAGDAEYPALRDASGRAWGHLLRDLRKVGTVTGNCFYWEGRMIRATPLATIPDGVNISYYKKLSLPAADDDDDVVDFPEEARSLIPAEAAYHAMHETWVPSQSATTRIPNNRTHKRTEVAALMRVSGGRQVMHDPRVIGSHYFL